MGNHVAGQAVGLAAKVVAKIRQQGETALSLLDRACKKYRGCDAEFESEDPSNPGTAHPESTTAIQTHTPALRSAC